MPRILRKRNEREFSPDTATEVSRVGAMPVTVVYTPGEVTTVGGQLFKWLEVISREEFFALVDAAGIPGITREAFRGLPADANFQKLKRTVGDTDVDILKAAILEAFNDSGDAKGVHPSETAYADVEDGGETIWCDGRFTARWLAERILKYVHAHPPAGAGPIEN